MTEQEKIEAAVTDLKNRGMSGWTASPPLFRLLWKLSVPIPPPSFLGFRGHLLLVGGSFALFLTLYLYLRPLFAVGDSDFPAGDPVWLAPILGLIGGAFFGITNYVYFRWRASRLGLPRWDAYQPPSQRQHAPDTRRG
jgi:hypothetical protein